MWFVLRVYATTEGKACSKDANTREKLHIRNKTMDASREIHSIKDMTVAALRNIFFIMLVYSLLLLLAPSRIFLIMSPNEHLHM